MSKKMNLTIIIKILILLLGVVVVVIPLTIVVLSSFKSEFDFVRNMFGLPKKIIVANYVTAWTTGNLGDYFFNSFYVTGASVGLQVILSSFLAFAIFRKESIIRKFIYPLIIFGLAIPYQSGIIPLFLQLQKYGLYNTHIGLILCYVALGIPLGTFILQGFFRQLPIEILDSATVDGCNNYRLYMQIIMPLSKPALTTVLIIWMVFVWNDFFMPLVLLSSRRLYTLPIGLMSLTGEFVINFPILFSGIIITCVTIIIMFIFFQRYFIEGVTAGHGK